MCRTDKGKATLAFGLAEGAGIASPATLRLACYDILGAVRAERDHEVRQILAGLAFTLAQRAQLESEREDRTKTYRG